MEVRYSPNPDNMALLTSEELREAFLVESLFKPDSVELLYSDADRAIIGSAVPVSKTLKLQASKKEMAAGYFAERREIGIINIADAGAIKVDGKDFEMNKKDTLYIGRGSKEISFSSKDKNKPACFYLVSYPAHASYPTSKMTKSEATAVNLGDQDHANKRTIYKSIHPGGLKSCQLVMGFTELEAGSIWNTMPPHTHMRRTEIYMYFDLPEENLVCHLMGQPDQTRHLFLRNRQAVISPSWSIHAGAGTSNYSFIWSMGGENQDFDDMDFIKLSELS